MKPDYWDDACRALARRDRTMGRIIRACGPAHLVSRGDAFQTLARSIVGQQISVKAAQAVWERFEALAGRVAPEAIVGLGDEAMRAAGLSRMKAAYLKDLAGRFHEGQLRPRRWARMDDEAVIADLVQVKGIGRWSVEMFLIFHLMRPDVLPVGDLGIVKAVQQAYGLRTLPSPDRLTRLGERWRPYRSVACWYLWASLDNAVKQAGR